jgi:hypothetical protein
LAVAERRSAGAQECRTLGSNVSLRRRRARERSNPGFLPVLTRREAVAAGGLWHAVDAGSEGVPIEKDAIRLCETSPEDLDACRTDHLVRVFRQISAVPEHAKVLRGRVFLVFPSYDDDPRPNWQIPSIRRFIQDLQRQLPHFVYYLHPDPTVGHVTMYLLCLVNVSDGGIDPGDIGTAVSAIAIALEGFCVSIDDTPDAIIRSLHQEVLHLL